MRHKVLKENISDLRKSENAASFCFILGSHLMNETISMMENGSLIYSMGEQHNRRFCSITTK